MRENFLKASAGAGGPVALQKKRGTVALHADAAICGEFSAFAGIGLHDRVADEFADRPARRGTIHRFFQKRFGLCMKRIEEHTQGALFSLDLFALIEVR